MAGIPWEPVDLNTLTNEMKAALKKVQEAGKDVKTRSAALAELNRLGTAQGRKQGFVEETQDIAFNWTGKVLMYYIKAAKKKGRDFGGSPR
jgi:hypothetical protein